MKYQVRISAGYRPSGIFSFPSLHLAETFIVEWKSNNSSKPGYESAIKGPITV